MYGSSFIQSSIGHIVYVTDLKGVRPSVFRMRDTSLLFDVGAAMMLPLLTFLTFLILEVLRIGQTSEL